MIDILSLNLFYYKYIYKQSCTMVVWSRHHALAPCSGTHAGGRNFLRKFRPVYGTGANSAL